MTQHEHDKGMMTLLSLYGNPEQLANEYLRKNKTKYQTLRPSVEEKVDVRVQ